MSALFRDSRLENQTHMSWRSSPIVWLLGLLFLFHLVLFWPAHNATQGYLQKNQEFKEIWNSGGAISLSKQGIEPNKSEEESRRLAFLREYVDQSPFYQIWMVPQWAKVWAFATSWLLQPGWFSLALLLWMLLYAGPWLEDIWGRIWPILLVISSSILASLAYDFLVTEVAENHAEVPFCGMIPGAALAAGALLRLHKNKIPIPCWWKKQIHFCWSAVTFVSIWFLLDFIAQGFINPQNYRWELILDLAAGAGGFALAGIIPQKKPQNEPLRSASIDPKIQIRNHLEEGWRLANLLEMESALGEIGIAIRMLLHGSQPDRQLVENTFTRLLSAEIPFSVSQQQWYEWGVSLAEANFPDLSVRILEQSAQVSGAIAELARPAIVQAAEIRLRHNLNPRDSLDWLERVIQNRDDDLMGHKALHLREEIAGKTKSNA
ncbi:MAG TPA: rhomboid family intramembrane serine protease [Fibrobacteraceae bacterium]|nr:rhomboid family intramembrane serine protease [Fibrobacteraceae bacterium]